MKPTHLAAATGLALLLLPGTLAAAYAALGAVPVQALLPGGKGWAAQPVAVEYQADPEALRVRLPGWSGQRRLVARLAVEKLPGYAPWVLSQQLQGGLTWDALKALLRQIQGRPVFILAEPVVQGPSLVVVGLVDGQRSQPYAQVLGQAHEERGAMVFDVQDVAWLDRTAALAWKVCLPVIRQQARTAAGQSRAPGL
ncbi:MAG TPA: hypothetical protein VNZ54_10275 [bacterium]|nr:hypothetical protein [bacterium]HXC65625.1 hypothetical protein [bacterium]